MAKNSIRKYEEELDKKLGIDTTGRDAINADENHHPYEPTPYMVLDRLIEEGYINESTSLVDYGSGKGRVGIYLSKMTGCRSIGIEYDEKLYALSLENLASSGVENAEFVCMDAVDYSVEDADSFFFFNPFSAKILNSVLSNIISGYYDEPRQIYLYFYYPDEEYISILMQSDMIVFSDEIDCRELFVKNDKRERILIFEIPYMEEE